MLPASAPSLANDASVIEWFARYERLAASPGMALATLRATGRVDVRPILPSIQAPTLLLYRADNAVVPVGHGRYLVQHIPNARLVELPGFDHAFFAGDTDRILDEAERFATGTVSSSPSERVLTTILFSDIVDSTVRAATLGDARWEQVLMEHDRAIRALLARHSGTIVKSTGDGVGPGSMGQRVQSNTQSTFVTRYAGSGWMCGSACIRVKSSSAGTTWPASPFISRRACRQRRRRARSTSHGP